MHKKERKQESELARKLEERGYIKSVIAAKRVGVHRATLYRWIRNGSVEAVDLSGAYYVQWDSVVRHLGQVAEVLGLANASET